MPIHSDMTSQLAEAKIQQLIAEAERERLVRSARAPRTLLRVRALRLAARGLRVERELGLKSAGVASRAGR